MYCGQIKLILKSLCCTIVKKEGCVVDEYKNKDLQLVICGRNPLSKPRF